MTSTSGKAKYLKAGSENTKYRTILTETRKESIYFQKQFISTLLLEKLVKIASYELFKKRLCVNKHQFLKMPTSHLYAQLIHKR
jgi:hypothetical protein